MGMEVKGLTLGSGPSSPLGALQGAPVKWQKVGGFGVQGHQVGFASAPPAGETRQECFYSWFLFKPSIWLKQVPTVLCLLRLRWSRPLRLLRKASPKYRAGIHPLGNPELFLQQKLGPSAQHCQEVVGALQGAWPSSSSVVFGA
jgi:hypothetical protein